MKKFKIIVDITNTHEVYVDANDWEEACDKVESMEFWEIEIEPPVHQEFEGYDVEEVSYDKD
jgi:hypothetical protein